MREQVGTLRSRAAAEVERRLEEYKLPETTKAQDAILNEVLVNLDYDI